MNAIIWIKDDLRIEDNPCVLAALREGMKHITFVRTDEGRCSHVKPTARRRAHEENILGTMEEVLARSGSRLIRTGPDAENLLKLCAEQGAEKIYANTQVGDNLGYDRDRKVARLAKQAGVQYIEISSDGLTRGTSPAAASCVTSARDLKPISFQAPPDALQRLRSYLDRLPRANYRRDMWLPGPDARASSRLSVDLACGSLASDRALHEIAEKAKQCTAWEARAFNEFANRIHWRRQFVQMLETNIDAFAWKPLREETPQDAAHMKAWLNGETGYPLVDAAMIDLRENGWINFRLRQVLSSFAIDLLGLDMHRVGVALGKLFDDYCPGIHWCQMALQSGMVQGRGPRVINPVKQARELDPQGEYVRRMLPHLRNEPLERIMDPHTNSLMGGWPVIVDHVHAARVARARYPSASRPEQPALGI